MSRNLVLHPWQVLLTAGLALCGCQAPTAQHGVITDHGERLLPVAISSRGASLTALVGAPAPQGYQVQYLRVLDWSVAEGTLSHSDASISPLTRSAAAAVNSQNVRQANLRFSPVMAGTGFSLSVLVKRPNLTGTPIAVASGTQSNLTLAQGNNTITVPLTPTADGHLALELPVPQVVIPGQLINPSGSTSLLAGVGGSSGGVDGSASVASFVTPEGLAAKGDLIYVGDAGGHRIRLINTALAPSSSSFVSTTAGALTAGFVDGNAANARFDEPSGLFMRANGHLLVCDRNNAAIRLVDTTLAPTVPNFVTTVAGDRLGFVDGPAATARFRSPQRVVVNSLGYAFIADMGNHRIRQINLNVAPTDPNFVTTFAGSGASASADGVGTSASFNQPYGITVDASDNLYVTEAAGHRVRKISPAGAVTTLAGGSPGYRDGSKALAEFQQPKGILFSNNRLYVADGTDTIRVINLSVLQTASDYVDTLAGLGTVGGYVEGQGSTARFQAPHGLARTQSGQLYVSDRGNKRVRLVQ